LFIVDITVGVMIVRCTPAWGTFRHGKRDEFITRSVMPTIVDITLRVMMLRCTPSAKPFDTAGVTISSRGA
jgi:hypothetical protein